MGKDENSDYPILSETKFFISATFIMSSANALNLIHSKEEMCRLMKG